MWGYRRRQSRRRTTVTKHYLDHKEAARLVVLNRLLYFNNFYNYKWNRVAIRNPRTCWGSCTSNKNLNFSYKLLFLPPHLIDYIIVHELCHLKEMNHSSRFWTLVEKQIPDYKERIRELKQIERSGGSIKILSNYSKIKRSLVSLKVVE